MLFAVSHTNRTQFSKGLSPPQRDACTHDLSFNDTCIYEPGLILMHACIFGAVIFGHGPRNRIILGVGFSEYF